jgi:Asp-tRNA(Asn)/Glu-tRNA(Gln) amidotransferase A subunit family amidase
VLILTCPAQIHASDETVGSFISVTAELAMEQVLCCYKPSRRPYVFLICSVVAHKRGSQARAVDDALASGIDPGLLAGIPFAIKV